MRQCLDLGDNMKKKNLIPIFISIILAAAIVVLLLWNDQVNANKIEEESLKLAAEEEAEAEAEAEIEAEAGTEAADTDADTDPEDLIDFDAEFPYIIYVNITLNRVVIYGIDYEGEYTVPYLGFVCSTGLEEGSTPTGTFTISDKYEWGYMSDGTYTQYLSRITESILFHSVPYYTMSKDDLETEEYNKLGQAASAGCIRLSCADSKWIYDNCPAGTTVIMYEDADEVFEVEFEDPIVIPEDSEYAGWDPTDPDENNPWNS